MTYHPPSCTTEVPLDTQQIKFILDLMMGCPMGYTKDHAYMHRVDENALYNHLDHHLHAALVEYLQ